MSEELTVKANGAMLGLPKFVEPASLDDAKAALLNLGRRLHENAYTVGKYLIWVKRNGGHGNFIPWVEQHIGMTARSVQQWMRFSKDCDERGYLLSSLYPKNEDSSHLDSPPLPEGKFRVLCADPPWSYSNSGFNQSAASTYTTMSTDAICELPVGDLGADDSVLFLWVTVPLLPEALRVVEAWGYEYKSAMFWVKDKSPGMGFWFRGVVEELWACAKGHPPLPQDPPLNVIHAPVTRHSEKPDVVYNIIEGMFDGPYVELFARETREGWTAWGAEAPTAVATDAG